MNNIQINKIQNYQTNFKTSKISRICNRAIIEKTADFNRLRKRPANKEEALAIKLNNNIHMDILKRVKEISQYIM